MGYQSDMGIRHHLDKTVCGTGEGQPQAKRKSYLGLYGVRDGIWYCKACDAEYQSDRGIRNHLDKSPGCSSGQLEQFFQTPLVKTEEEDDYQDDDNQTDDQAASHQLTTNQDINNHLTTNHGYNQPSTEQSTNLEDDNQVVDNQLTTAIYNQLATPNHRQPDDNLVSTCYSDKDPLVSSATEDL